jgi:transcriptional regulator with XRE-family HTH domain
MRIAHPIRRYKLMGQSKRTQPKRLKNKLKAIRTRLDLTQEEMVLRLKKYAPREFIDTGYVSRLENGKREPTLPILLAYSKLTGLSINLFVDDDLDLPKRLPKRKG